MKPVKAIFTAAIVALALSVPAYAGEISSPGSPCTAPGAPAVASPEPGDVGFPPLADILLALIPYL